MPKRRTVVTMYGEATPMDRSPKYLSMIGLASAVALVALSCSQESGGERKRTAAKTTNENKDLKCSTSAPTNTPSTTSTTSTTTQTGGTATTTGDDDTTPITAGLLLADVPYSTISTAMTGKCAYSGCHAAGGIKPDLSTEALAKTSAQGISDRVQSTTSPMPPKSVAAAKQLSVSERDNMVAWAKGILSGGTTATTGSTTSTTTDGGSTSTGSTTSTGTTSTDSSNCTNSSPTPDPDTSDTGTGGTTTDDKEDTLVISAAYKLIMEPDALKTCQGQGKMYDWKNSRCDTAAYSATVTCNKDLVLKSYPNNSTVTEAVTMWEANKWRYNQCGTENSKLVVWMICPSVDGTTCVSDEALESGSQAGSATIRFNRLPSAN